MAEMNLDPRLAALLPVIEELKGLRAYLKQLSDREAEPGTPAWMDTDSATVDKHRVRAPFWYPIKWINDSLRRVEPHFHTRRWPPVWWRLSKVDFDWICHSFHRVDADGYFFEPGHPDRDKILAWVDRIDEMYQKARKQA